MPDGKKCPDCGKINAKEAVVCIGCGKDLAVAAPLLGFGREKPAPLAAKLPWKLLLVAWLAVLLTPFLSHSLLWYVAHWASLGLGVALIRSPNKVARVNGWLVVAIFAFVFILTVFVAPFLF